MSEPESPDSIEDVIDSIAEMVPDNRRTAYYRDMGYLHALPKSDEMLHILKVIGWTVVIMVQVPLRIAAEIAKLDRILRDHFEAQQRIDQRLEHVFHELIERVSAEAIAKQLYESLRQQFVKSAIPQTGKALVVVANHIQQAVASLEGATPKIAAVTDTSRQAIAALSKTFLHTYRWALLVFLVLAALLGFWGGVLAVQSGYLAK
jgi:hypothetical protein